MKAKRHILIAGALLSGTTMQALPQLNNTNTLQEIPDTTELTTELDGIVVEASGKRLSVEGFSVIPNSNQKKGATDGYDLVRRLGIPQLLIRPGQEEIKTLSDQSVSTYINYAPASQTDVAGLDPKSVVKVEYLENPIDPRFGGSSYVINYILKPQEYGGYTRLAATSAAYGMRIAYVSAFSKLYWKDLTFDLFLGYDYNNQHHGGQNSNQWFMLKDSNGSDYEQLRTETTDWYRSRDYSLPVSLRVSYNTEKIQVSNNLSYTWNDNPSTINNGRLHFYPGAENDYQYWRNGQSKSNSVSWNGNFFFQLPKNFSLKIVPSVVYSHYNNASSYLTSRNNDNGIINNSKDDAFRTRTDLYFTRMWSEHISLGIQGKFSYMSNNVDYWGTAPSANKMVIRAGSGGFVFNGQWNSFSVYAEGGVIDDNTSTNGINIHLISPLFYTNINWLVNPKHRLSLYALYATNTPPVSDKSESILQENEFMYITGNPDYKTHDFFETNLNYMWMLNNHFTLMPQIYYHVDWKPGQTVFSQFLDGSAIIRRPINSGNYQDFNGLLRVRYAPTSSLMFEGMIKYYHKAYEGINHIHINDVHYAINAMYFIKQFSVSAYFERIGKDLIPDIGAIKSIPNNVALLIGWADKGWNITCGIIQPFKYTWKYAKEQYHSQYYTYNQNNYQANAHCSVQMRVAYTFRYGKQKNDNSEIGAGSKAESGILK